MIATKRRPSRALRALRRIAEIIESVDQRCMAVDGPVTPTLREMTQDELSEIYRLAISRRAHVIRRRYQRQGGAVSRLRLHNDGQDFICMDCGKVIPRSRDNPYPSHTCPPSASEATPDIEALEMAEHEAQARRILSADRSSGASAFSTLDVKTLELLDRDKPARGSVVTVTTDLYCDLLATCRSLIADRARLSYVAEHAAVHLDQTGGATVCETLDEFRAAIDAARNTGTQSSGLASKSEDAE